MFITNPNNNIHSQKGFTLVELIVIIGLFAILTMFVGLNMIKPQISINIDATVNLLVSDIKSQQIKAMAGSNFGLVSSQNFGIYFESDKYTLFTGATYNPTDPKNFVINITNGVTLSNNLTGSQIVFAKETGEIISYTSGSNIVITHSSGTSKTIGINSLGVVTIN